MSAQDLIMVIFYDFSASLIADYNKQNPKNSSHSFKYQGKTSK
jgi:hypothetical protein